MKKFVVYGAVVIVVALMFCVNAIAAGPKIGCFDLQAAISNSEDGKKLLDQLKAEEERLGGVLQQKASDFMKVKDEYEKKKDSMDEKTRNRKEKELTDMYSELQKLRNESQAKFNEEKSQGMQPMLKKVRDIANKVGREDKFDYIFEKNAIYYLGNEKEDLTKRITSELDKAR
jgi:outer membrane protein